MQFPDRREVFIDGISYGDCRDAAGIPCVLRVPEGLHAFRLGGAEDYVPLRRTVLVKGTDAVTPMIVAFQQSA